MPCANGERAIPCSYDDGGGVRDVEPDGAKVEGGGPDT